MAAKDPKEDPTPRNGEPERCGAKRRNGEPCRKWPLAGTNRCRLHGGASPQAQRLARERIIGAADLAAKRLMEFMNDKRVPWSVRLAATRDLLDRANVTGDQVLKVEATHKWDDTFEDGVIVITDHAADDPEIAASNAAAIEPTPVLRALPSAQETGDREPLEGVVIPSEQPSGSVRIPRHVAEGLRRQGYDI